MRVFLAGATGAVGKALVPMLTANGHTIIGATRTQAKLSSLRSAGVEPVLADILDRDSIVKAVSSVQPDVIVHQCTSLTNLKDLKHWDDEFEMTNRLRTEGTDNLIAAALTAGTRRLVVQSFTGWPNERVGSRIKTEADALDPDPPKAMSRTLDAIRRMEEAVLRTQSITSVVLRYGSFYGPGTSVDNGGSFVEAIRERKFPLVGSGAGVWSWIHMEDVASATKLAIEGEMTGTYNIVDDEPAEVSIWLPYLAEIVGAKKPLHIPAWIGRLAIGDSGVSMMTQIRGSSNAKAKRVLGWQPRYTSWRQGFLCGLSPRAEVDLAGKCLESAKA